jgi:enediyne core biosynthesis thioesterase
MNYFEWRHVVSFEETNLVGNAYYARYVGWQGRCREMFLRQVCPEVLADLQSGLKMFTLNVSCEYLTEVTAFDEIVLRLSLEELTRTQIAFAFDYLHGGELIARGRQRVVCMRTEDGKTVPARVPESLRSALERLEAAPPGTVLTASPLFP